jgi:hypothetical protein
MLMVEEKEIVVAGRFIKTALLRDEWLEEVENPESFIGAMKKQDIRADLFTFWQKLPETEPKYAYYMERDPIAAIPIKSYEHWMNHQIERSARKAVRKAEKKGVTVSVSGLNDDLVKGIMTIYNETPIRQGRPYPHYGKDFDTVKEDLSRDQHRSDFICSYAGGELIGFIQLGYTGVSVLPFGMVSKLEHRDKSPQNAMLAKAIEICEAKKIRYLWYGKWGEDSLGDFKKNNGCEKLNMPRYYIPLSAKGALALKYHLHHGLAEALPEKAKLRMKEIRKKWYAMKHRRTEPSEKEQE